MGPTGIRSIWPPLESKCFLGELPSYASRATKRLRCLALDQGAVHFGGADCFGDAEEFQDADGDPGEIEPVPSQAVAFDTLDRVFRLT